MIRHHRWNTHFERLRRQCASNKSIREDASIHLHARRIEFIHPVKKEPVVITAPPPNEVLWNEFTKRAQNI